MSVRGARPLAWLRLLAAPLPIRAQAMQHCGDLARHARCDECGRAEIVAFGTGPISSIGSASAYPALTVTSLSGCVRPGLGWRRRSTSTVPATPMIAAATPAPAPTAGGTSRCGMCSPAFGPGVLTGALSGTSAAAGLELTWGAANAPCIAGVTVGIANETAEVADEVVGVTTGVGVPRISSTAGWGFRFWWSDRLRMGLNVQFRYAQHQPRPDESRVSQHVPIIQTGAVIRRIQLGPALLGAKQAGTDTRQTVASADGVPALAVGISLDRGGWLRHDQLPAWLDHTARSNMRPSAMCRPWLVS